MRILLVGRPDSDYLVRWLALVPRRGWETRVFPPTAGPRTRFEQGRVPFFSRANDLEQLFRHDSLLGAIERFRPDAVHSIGTLECGELTLAARARKTFRWIATSLGDDVGELAGLPRRKALIQKVKASCDRFTTESAGSGATPILPHGAAFVLERSARAPGIAPSRRRKVLVEGNFDLYGRSLVALAALQRCAGLLRGREVLVSSPTPEVALAAEVFSRATGVATKALPRVASRADLARYGEAAISLNLSIGGGLNPTVIEAMHLGAFPIESRTGSAGEWIVSGKTGFLVDPDDPASVERAVRTALENPALLDEAAKINRETLRTRFAGTDPDAALRRFYSSAP